MDSNQVPVEEITSKAAVYRIAAEIIEADARKNTCFRLGCCAAFNRIIDAVRYLPAKVEKMVYEAKDDFAEIYREEGARRTKDSCYWMGTRNNMGQNRRITALLVMAEMVE